MFDKFIDRIRMITLKHEREHRISIPVIQRIYPRIVAAANRGQNRVIYSIIDGQITTADWVKKNWDEIKAYLESEGFNCQYYDDSDEYHIMW